MQQMLTMIPMTVKPCTPTKKSYNYFTLSLKHKWYVFLSGIKIKCPLWRLITHDLSKFSFIEYPFYQNFFFGNKTMELEFSRAWLHHQNTNDHHWEYWLPRSGHSLNNNLSDLDMIEMTDGAALEMVSDWMGASWAYGGFRPNKDNWPWLMHQGKQVLLNRLSYINAFKVIAILKVNQLINDEFIESIINEIIDKRFENKEAGNIIWELTCNHMLRYKKG